MMAAENPSIGIYRTAFPLYSETFISEQTRSLSAFSPLVIARSPTGQCSDLPVCHLAERSRTLPAALFTTLGYLGAFKHEPRLAGLRLLHAHFAPDAVLALPLARHLRIPLVTTCHGSDVTTSALGMLRRGRLSDYRYLLQRRTLFEQGARFIAVSDFLKGKMIAAGFPGDKTVRHYVGIDTRRFVPASGDKGLGDGSRFILSIARHTDVKGVDVLLQAFAKISPRFPDLRLVQVGGGELTPTLKQLAQQLGVAERTIFTGPLPAHEVLPYVQRSEALVLSSRRSANGAEEAFGLVLIEAAACGIPCIGTKTGGIPETMIDGETGFLVEEEDALMLADRIRVLLEDSYMAREMGRRGREFVCDNFDLNKQTQSLERIYAELV